MDERQQLLACASNCTALLNDMARCENEYSYLFEKETRSRIPRARSYRYAYLSWNSGTLRYVGDKSQKTQGSYARCC